MIRCTTEKNRRAKLLFYDPFVPLKISTWRGGNGSGFLNGNEIKNRVIASNGRASVFTERQPISERPVIELSVVVEIERDRDRLFVVRLRHRSISVLDRSLTIRRTWMPWNCKRPWWSSIRPPRSRRSARAWKSCPLIIVSPSRWTWTRTIWPWKRTTPCKTTTRNRTTCPGYRRPQRLLERCRTIARLSWPWPVIRIIRTNNRLKCRSVRWPRSGDARLASTLSFITLIHRTGATSIMLNITLRRRDIIIIIQCIISIIDLMWWVSGSMSVCLFRCTRWC